MKYIFNICCTIMLFNLALTVVFIFINYPLIVQSLTNPLLGVMYIVSMRGGERPKMYKVRCP